MGGMGRMKVLWGLTHLAEGLLLGWGLTRDALALTHATISPAVFSQGDKGTSWYIVWKGSVNVVTHGKVGASPRLHPIPAVTLVPRCTVSPTWPGSGSGLG